jgi:ATP-binding cassette subfamily F protein uup
LADTLDPVANLLSAEALHVEYPHGVVFGAVSLGIDEGARIGIVGRNGDGKSTLLRLLSGRQEPDGGNVTTRRGLDIGMLDQADTLPDGITIAETIVGDTPEHEWAGNPRTRDVISGLVADLPWNESIDDLSGGQRRRVALAALLVGDHDVVFLDEPTNHLDMEGITWLAAHIKSRWQANAGGFVVVTHDRWFLDEVCTTTWEVHDGVVEPFDGGYAAYILQRVERDRISAVKEAKRQNLMKKELAWLRRGPPARTSKPKFRIDAANELIADEPPVRDTVALHQFASSRLGNDVVDLLDVGVSYGDKQVLRDVEWRIAPGERAGILGINGAGKSTLLNLVTGALQPTTGRVKRGKTVQIATLSQQSAELDAMRDKRVRDILADKRTTYRAAGKEFTTSQLLERLGFTNAHLKAYVKELSGGQKRRLHLLLTLLDEPNVLVLDEPSNDLDTDMLAAMEDLLDSWPGTLLVVSHDRYFMERVTDVQYAVSGGLFRHLPGGIDQYLQLQTGAGASSTTPAKAGSSGPKAKAARPASAASANIDRYALQKEMASVERKLAKLPGQIQQAEAKIEAHDQTDYQGLGELAGTLNALKAKQADLEHRWLELSELLE